MVGIVGEKLGIPRYDPAADKARRENVIELMKSPEATNQRKEIMKERTPYKFVDAKIITYYANNGGYCLVAYDTVNKRASAPLGRSNSREEIERMVASYDEARKAVGKAATRKMKETFVARANHQVRAPRGPEVER